MFFIELCLQHLNKNCQKLANSTENLAIVQDNSILSIEKRTFPEGMASIQLFVNNYQHTEFVFVDDAANLPEGKSVFVKDNYLSNAVQLYPVPVEDQLNISSSHKADLGIEVFNMLGQRVLKSRLDANQEQQISTSSLEAGVYVVQISDGQVTFNKQIIKN